MICRFEKLKREYGSDIFSRKLSELPFVADIIFRVFIAEKVLLTKGQLLKVTSRPVAKYFQDVSDSEM